MRDFSSVSPQFWIGSTGKQLRGDSKTQVLAMYLMTCPHANMIGVFHCPVMYMAHETGLSMEDVEQSLEKLILLGFCVYDHENDSVFVVNMASFQVGTNLKEYDNKVKGVQKYVEKIQSCLLKKAFVDRYLNDFHLGYEAPSKPLRSHENTLDKQLTGTEQEQEQEQEITTLVTSKLATCPHQEILSIFAEELPELPQPRSWEGQRASHLQARWKWVLSQAVKNGQQPNKEYGIDFFRRMFAYIAQSDFLMGRNGKWSCDLGWIVNATNFAKIIDGVYENKEAA